VSGMREDLNFQGNQLNQINTSKRPRHATVKPKMGACIDNRTLVQSSTAAMSSARSPITLPCRSSRRAFTSPAV
jgi:hypothetical protein